MRESFTYGSVGRAPGNRCLYPEVDPQHRAEFSGRLKPCASAKLSGKSTAGN